MTLATFAIIVVASLIGGGVYFVTARWGAWLAFMLAVCVTLSIIELLPEAWPW